MRGAAIRSSSTRSPHEHATASGFDPDADRSRQRPAGVRRVAASGHARARAGARFGRSAATANAAARSGRPASAGRGADDRTAGQSGAFFVCTGGAHRAGVGGGIARRCTTRRCIAGAGIGRGASAADGGRAGGDDSAQARARRDPRPRGACTWRRLDHCTGAARAGAGHSISGGAGAFARVAHAEYTRASGGGAHECADRCPRTIRAALADCRRDIGHVACVGDPFERAHDRTHSVTCDGRRVHDDTGSGAADRRIRRGSGGDAAARGVCKSARTCDVIGTGARGRSDDAGSVAGASACPDERAVDHDSCTGRSGPVSRLFDCLRSREHIVFHSHARASVRKLICTRTDAGPGTDACHSSDGCAGDLVVVTVWERITGPERAIHARGCPECATTCGFDEFGRTTGRGYAAFDRRCERAILCADVAAPARALVADRRADALDIVAGGDDTCAAGRSDAGARSFARAAA
jgi:hypothetical protein